MLKIWGRSNSINVQKVLWCCAELDLPFERVDWGGPFGGNDDPAYRAMNPNGRVPTIEDGNNVVWESNTCTRYLCDTTPGGEHLLPREPYRRSTVERWMDWHLSTINRPMSALFWGLIRTPADERNPAALEAARKQLIPYWEILDRQLAYHAYVAGTHFTLADIGIGCYAWRWFNVPIERPELKHLTTWMDRLGERPGFKQHVALPLS